MAQLHSKLQAAARCISQLSQEKEQLIQMGNRVRAELAKYTGGRRSVLPGTLAVQPPQPPLSGIPEGKTQGK